MLWSPKRPKEFPKSKHLSADSPANRVQLKTRTSRLCLLRLEYVVQPRGMAPNEASRINPKVRWTLVSERKVMDTVVQIPLSEVVLDFDLYPRGQIDSTNVSEMIDACKAGVELPPILLDRKSKRCIDGFHRYRRAERMKEPAIAATLKDYKSEAEMLLDALRLNAQHGRKLSPFDRTRASLLADKLGIERSAVAEALSVPIEKLESLQANKSARAGSLTIPIKRTIHHMAGRKLNKRQVETNRKLSGSSQKYLVRQLIMLIGSKLLDMEDEELMEELGKLHEELGAVVEVMA